MAYLESRLNSNPEHDPYEGLTDRPLSPLPPERMARLATFRDSRGQTVPRWPDALVPSVTIILFRWIPGESSYTAPQVLCHQRKDNGYWGFPGGRVEIGESLHDAVHRECLEETGFAVEIKALTSVDSDPQRGSICIYPDGNIIQYVNASFVCASVGGALRLSGESLALAWHESGTLPEPFLPLHAWRLTEARQWLKHRS
mgnify:FL=1